MVTVDERIEALTASLEVFARETRERAAQRERELELFARETRERAAQHERELEAVKDRQRLIDDNMIVQGQLVARLETRMDLLAEDMRELAQTLSRFIRAQGNGQN
jgi:hypothetical protein